MRQTLLMLVIAIAFGSPLAMAEDAGDAATSSATGANASQRHAAASQDSGKPARKPVSAFGRALAELLRANQPAAPASQHRTDLTTSDAVAPSDIDAAHRTQLAAQTGPDRTP